jgi:hypothetical protein
MYGFVVLGILVSIVLPILRQLLPKARRLGPDDPPAWKVYLAVGLFSLLTAVIILAIARDKVPNWQWQDALLAGFAWDSMLQKVVSG